MDKTIAPPPPAEPNLTPDSRTHAPSGRLSEFIFNTVVLLLIFGFACGSFLPLFNGTAPRSRVTAAAALAHGIHIGLMQYAVDHEGSFPTAEHDSNEALRQLVPRYVENEKPFYVAGSAWHEPTRQGNTVRGPDNVIGEGPDYPKALEKGENHWAYVSGLTNSSDSNIPVIADGLSDTPGTYSTDPAKRGGVWHGTRAIVCYADGSIRTESVDAGTLRILRHGHDLFGPERIPTDAKVLNPR